MRARWVLLAGLLLAGCKLIDQTTFAPSPEETAAKQEAPKVDPRTPLVTIGATASDASYEDVLRYAVQPIEGRLPPSAADVSVFIDIIGMPWTPLSYAGVARRSFRRAYYWR